MLLSSGVRWRGSSLADYTSGDTYIKIIRDQTHIDNEVVIIGLLTLLLLLFVVAAVFVSNMMEAFFIPTR